MLAHSFEPLVVDLATLLLKATLVSALAFGAHAVAARWMSAASRHLVVLLAVAMLLALPVLSIVLPGWTMPMEVALAPEVAVAPATPLGIADWSEGGAALAGQHQDTGSVSVAPVTRVPWAVVVLTIYAVGVVGMAAHLLVQRRRVQRLGRGARDVTDAEWLGLLADGRRILGVSRAVRLLRSVHGTMPMTFGVWRPAIVLPATADTWDVDRRRAVILHELAHVARHDCLAQWAACTMRVLYWGHPGAWWLVARLRLDREFACDDLVLAAGTPPVDYARHLLDIAYAFGGGRATALAVRMARRSQIEARLQALLDASRQRRRPSVLAQRATMAGAFAVLLPLSSLTHPLPVPVASQAPVPVTLTEAWTEPVSSSTDPLGETSPLRSAPVAPHVVPAPLSAPAPLATPAPLAAPAPRALQTATPAASLPAASGACAWDIGRGRENQLYLSIRQGRSHSGRSVPIAMLEGLTDAQLATGGAVHFVLRRDAGTFTFDGTARSGVAAGVCAFTASPNFGAELARRGVTGLTPAAQEQLARYDVGLALIDELKAQKYATPTVADLVTAGQHGVQVEYVRGMGALGYATGSLAPLITLRDHGVTPEYARALASFGYARLPVDLLQRARDHGVTADYIKGMRDAGHGTLTLDQLITTRDHGVTPEFGQALAAAGYDKVPLDQLVRVRDHGVTADYIRDMKARGLSGTLDDLVRMRDHGVSVGYVTDVQALGYADLSKNDLIALRSHGLTADRIRQANARAGSRLAVSELLDAARSGLR
jgi:beta-lactamase regulating signal transducer with metallopeptidase domain